MPGCSMNNHRLAHGVFEREGDGGLGGDGDRKIKQASAGKQAYAVRLGLALILSSNTVSRWPTCAELSPAHSSLPSGTHAQTQADQAWSSAN
jgi:hypothetical protein